MYMDKTYQFKNYIEENRERLELQKEDVLLIVDSIHIEVKDEGDVIVRLENWLKSDVDENNYPLSDSVALIEEEIKNLKQEISNCFNVSEERIQLENIVLPQSE